MNFIHGWYDLDNMSDNIRDKIKEKLIEMSVFFFL